MREMEGYFWNFIMKVFWKFAPKVVNSFFTAIYMEWEGISWFRLYPEGIFTIVLKGHVCVRSSCLYFFNLQRRGYWWGDWVLGCLYRLLLLVLLLVFGEWYIG